MTAADIAAARARVVESAAGLRLSAGWTMQPASGRELLAIDHALALSDLLLAMTMTAPEPAPAEPSLPADYADGLEPEARMVAEARADVAREVKPERVAVLESQDAEPWRIYSDGTDDNPHCQVDWSAELAQSRLFAGRKYVWTIRGPSWRESPRGAYTALIDWPPAPTPAPANKWPEAEPRTVEDTARELLVCARSWEPDARLLGNIRAADMARLAGRVAMPAPAGPPSLWEWVRAACVSRLGEPRMHTLRGGALQWVLPHTVIWALRDDHANGGVWRVQRDSGETMGATCTTPAELTAALDALAEEVGK